MIDEVVWKVGGQQGEGIDSTGELFALALARKGYYISSNKLFASRIKGGYTHYQVRAATKQIFYHGDYTNILIALDEETIENNLHTMQDHSIIFIDGDEQRVEKKSKATIITLPFTNIADQIGSKIIRNMVALGASAGFLDLGMELFDSLIKDKFSSKGEKTIQMNKEAIRAGYSKLQELMKENNLASIKLSKPVEEKTFNLIGGNHAVAFGALTAGCRFLSAYPITPASEIMEWLKKELPAVGGTVVQTEDEIAGITMALGASYSGVRAMTSTSGPGLSLKTEAIGLAGMSETPIVIVNSQRGGPSTGLPTKYEQSDIYTMIHAGHGDIPRIVLAPSTVEEAFYMTQEAFNYAEKYQCPVILAMDLYLSLFKQTVNKLDFHKVKIDRGKLINDDETQKNQEKFFLRYERSDDGISNRTIPGQIGGIHTANSNEHMETGHITEDIQLRTDMMEKRLGKLAGIKEPGFEIDGPTNAELLLIGFGSTYGVIKETIAKLRAEGINVSHAHVKRLAPFDLSLADYIVGAKQSIVIENNYSGQLKRLIQMETSTGKTLKSILKYDGNPFTLEELLEHMKKILDREVK